MTGWTLPSPAWATVARSRSRRGGVDGAVAGVGDGGEVEVEAGGDATGLGNHLGDALARHSDVADIEGLAAGLVGVGRGQPARPEALPFAGATGQPELRVAAAQQRLRPAPPPPPGPRRRRPR